MLNSFIIPSIQTCGIALPFVLGLGGGYLGYWLIFKWSVWRSVNFFDDNYDSFSKALSISVAIVILVLSAATIQSILKSDGLFIVIFGCGLIGYLVAHRKYLKNRKELWLRYRNLTTQSRGPPWKY